MTKPRIIIADTDISYMIPLQLKFIEEFFEKIDLEIITNREYFEELFSNPQRVDILIISEELYDSSILRHNISKIFLMSENYEEDQTAELNVNRIYKYTSIKEILNEIIGKSSDIFNLKRDEIKETQVILFYSACGGVGKTTLAMGVSAALTKNYKRILYIDAEHLQLFQYMLENQSSINTSDIYRELRYSNESIYSDIKHIIRNELFNYLPPFKASLISLGLDYSIFEKIILSAKKSGEYDFIIVDTDVVFDEDKATLMNIANKVMIVTKQNYASVLATNILVSNINGINSEKYIFICNDFDKNADNALISSHISMKFNVSEYIDHLNNYEKMKPKDLAEESSIQRTTFLII